MQHGRARGRVSASKALGFAVRQSVSVARHHSLFVAVEGEGEYLSICGWMDGYILSGSEIPLAWNCRRWSSFSLLFASLSPSPPPSLTIVIVACV